jgi:hypothetical protein
MKSRHLLVGDGGFFCMSAFISAAFKRPLDERQLQREAQPV